MRRHALQVCTLLVFAALLPLGLSNCGKGTGNQSATVPSRHSPQEAVFIDKIPDSQITAVLDQELSPGRNLIWCATMQLAWNEMCDSVLEGPAKLEGDPPLQVKLNKREANESDLDAPSYVAMAGSGKDKIVEKINGELKRKFGAGAHQVDIRLTERDVLAYSYLLKNLSFEWAFEVQTDELSWKGKAGSGTPLRTFGLKKIKSSKEKHARLLRQVRIHQYLSTSDFIIELLFTERQDRLFLALVDPKATLKETVESVRSRIDPKGGFRLSDGDCLLVPCLGFHVWKNFKEIESKRVLNPDQSGFVLTHARQRIRFDLNETGASLESEAVIESKSEESQVEPKHLVFDRPFLVLMQRRDAKAPYLAIWVGNPELLVEAK